MKSLRRDAGLLVALDALLTECSVGAAADRLDLSLSTMSHTLGRIRRLTGDDILVRAGGAMVLTPYAESIRGEVRALVERVHTVLSPIAAIDPAQVRRTFTLRVDDVFTAEVVPRIVHSVGIEAPGVTIHLLGRCDDRAGVALCTGEVDVDLGTDILAEPGLCHRLLGASSRVLVGSTQTLWAFDGPGLEELAELRHITVARHGGSGDEVDDLLAEHGLKRRVAFTVPTFDAAVAAVAGTRFVTVAPSITLRRFQHHHLHLRPLPFRVEPLHAVLSWHVRTDREPAHAWLRDRVAAAVRDALG